MGTLRGLVYVESYGNDLKAVFYDTGLPQDFTPTITFNIGDSSIRFIQDVTCQTESHISQFTFSCILLSGSSVVSELFFEFNSITQQMRKVNTTFYNHYKDYNSISLKAYKKYFVVASQSFSDNFSSLLVYKRKSHNGTEHLFAGINADKFGNVSISELDYTIYEYNNVYKIYIQPFYTNYSVILALDDFKIAIKEADLNYLNGFKVNLNNGLQMTLGDAFFFGNSNNNGNGNSSATNTPATSSGMLVLLIIFVVIVVLGLFGGIGYILWKKNQEKSSKSYIDRSDQENNAASFELNSKSN